MDFVIVIGAFVAFACIVAPLVALGVVGIMGMREGRRHPTRQVPSASGSARLSTEEREVR